MNDCVLLYSLSVLDRLVSPSVAVVSPPPAPPPKKKKKKPPTKNWLSRVRSFEFGELTFQVLCCVCSSERACVHARACVYVCMRVSARVCVCVCVCAIFVVVVCFV